MTKTARYIQVDDADDGLQRTKGFPKAVPVLGTDSNGNPVDAFSNGMFNNKVDISWEKSANGKALESTVYQLTGMGASLVERTVKYSSGTIAKHLAGNGISTNLAYGRACDYGYVYRKIGNVKIKTTAWIAQSSNGMMFISYDRFKTVVQDTSLQQFSMGQYGAQCLVYAKVSTTATNFSWICFPGGSSNIYYIEDIPENYNDDGTFVSGNWQSCNPGLSRIEYASHVVKVSGGGFLYTSWGLNGVMHVTDLVNGVGVVATINNSEEISGIATDSYGTYYVVSRNNGKIYKNITEKSGAFDNAKLVNNTQTAWVQVTRTNDKMTVDGVAADNLPCSGTGDGLTQTWWAGLGCAYGLWVCTVANKAHDTDPIYAYSDNGFEWFTYGSGKSLPITTWDMKTDGSHWFACPTGPSDYLVYQILINSIPAHKRLIAEKGLMVAGDTFLSDIPSAPLLGTDGNGKVVGVYGDISALPKGVAGGDLSGLYPNPLVDELSGSGNSFRVVTTLNADGSGSFIPDSDPFAHYSMAIKSEAGLAMFINLSNDVYFSKNGGLNWTFLYNLGGGSGMDIAYGRISAGVYGWAVCGQNQIIWFEDLSGNYDSNGLPLLSAWKSKSRASSDWADIANNSNTGDWFFALEAAGLFYSSSLSTSMTFTQVIPQGATGTEGGIFVDQTNNRIVYFERTTGRVWWASGSSYANPTDWTEVLLNGVPVLKAIYPQIGVSGKGVGAGVECKNICTFVGDVTIYATNVTDASTYQRATSTVDLPKLWNVCTDGVNVFGTRDDWSWSGIYPYKVIFQLYNDVIPAHKTFVAERDVVVLNDEYLIRIPDYDVLSTSPSGKIYGKKLPRGYEFIGTDENGGFKGAGLSSPFSQELFPFSIWQARVTIFGQIGNNSTCAFPFIANRSQSISMIKIAIGHGGQSLRLGLIDGSSKKVMALTEEKPAIYTEETFINTYKINKSISANGNDSVEITGGKLYYLLISAATGTSDQTELFCIANASSDGASPTPYKTDVNYMSDSWLNNQIIGNSNTPQNGIPYRPWMSFE